MLAVKQLHGVVIEYHHRGVGHGFQPAFKILALVVAEVTQGVIAHEQAGFFAHNGQIVGIGKNINKLRFGVVVSVKIEKTQIFVHAGVNELFAVMLFQKIVVAEQKP